MNSKADGNCKQIIDFARSLLTGLERDVLDVRSHPRRTEMQASLSKKKEDFESVVDRMNDLKEIGLRENEEMSEVEEDILGPILQDLEKKGYKFTSQPETTAFTEDVKDDSIPEEGGTWQNEKDVSAKEIRLARQLPTEPSPPPTQTSQKLRPRHGPSEVGKSAPSTTSSAETTRAVLFRKSKSRPTTHTSTATAEALQDRHRHEQDSLIEQILQFSSGLHATALRFNDKMESEKLTLQKAEHAMDKAETGMESAGRRMTGLRRITEGEGWWGRMKLYAFIYGLMLLLVVVVFVLPKLRL